MKTEILHQVAQQMLSPIALFALVLGACWAIDLWFCGRGRRHGL